MNISPARRLLALLTVAVNDACEQHPNVGCNISGGVDSSTVVTLARLTGHNPPTFSGYYDEGPDFDERQYSRLVAGNDHHEIKITPDDIAENFDAMMEVFRPPFQGPGAMGQYIVAKHACRYVDTVLSGEGGDELFGGYARLMKVAGAPLPDGYENYQLPDGYPDTLEAALAWDYERLPDLLAVDDQACAPWGLTAVAPMTDQRVVDFALALPAEKRVGKTLLKQAVTGLVPDGILNRTDKKGMPAPFVKWGQGPLREFFLDRIGYVPDPGRPWDRQWWHDLTGNARVTA